MIVLNDIQFTPEGGELDTNIVLLLEIIKLSFMDIQSYVDYLESDKSHKIRLRTLKKYATNGYYFLTDEGEHEKSFNWYCELLQIPKRSRVKIALEVEKKFSKYFID
jgi:hypothetical protein